MCVARSRMESRKGVSEIHTFERYGHWMGVKPRQHHPASVSHPISMARGKAPTQVPQRELGPAPRYGKYTDQVRGATSTPSMCVALPWRNGWREAVVKRDHIHQNGPDKPPPRWAVGAF